jgi:hypothetical protein
MEIIAFINTNTGQLIPNNTLQATLNNTIVIYPSDIYGNQIEGLSGLSFNAVLFDGVNYITSKILIALNTNRH